MGHESIQTTGLIPAHAGKTTPRNCPAWRARAHPRSRGENDLIRVAGYLSVGSSPLTRGKRGGVPFGGVGLRLIPAHAGKTASSPLACG